jgi:molecular chaperone DnaK (HSP70)
MAVFGIDLGTTYSCVAHLDDAGRPAVVRNAEGTDTTPSVVYFESADNIVVGASAKETAVIHPDLVVSLIKREMGQDYVTPEIHDRTYLPEEVSALILRKLTADAAVFTGEPADDVVITVPAYFGIAEREATRKAGEIAGLNVIDIISEPIAAAIDYGVLRPGEDRSILVYDLGGGTFDTTVITLRGGDIEVVCTDGDHNLGGADWDLRLVEHLAESFRTQHADASEPLAERETEQELRTIAEDTKKHLSALTQRTVRVMHDGRRATVDVTRERFEELTRDLLDRTVDITRRTVEEAARRGVSTFDDVLLVGGSTRMPAVRERLAAELGFDPKLHDPDLSVAKGAARYAFEETYRRLLSTGETGRADELASRAGLSDEAREAMSKRKIRTVSSRSFGIVVRRPRRTDERLVAHLIHGNDPLPADVTEEFYTIKDNQTGVLVQVMEQAGPRESDQVENNSKIAEGEVEIPPGKLAGWPIEVTFQLSTSGLLRVAAVEKETGDRLDLSIQVGGMTGEQVESSRKAITGLRVR